MHTSRAVDRTLELRHLARSDAAVAQGRESIARQRQAIADLERCGLDTTQAREVLRTMLAMQRLHEEHREIILRELARQG